MIFSVQGYALCIERPFSTKLKVGRVYKILSVFRNIEVLIVSSDLGLNCPVHMKHFVPADENGKPFATIRVKYTND